jgi:nitrite reductase (NADH) small subunit
MLATCLPRVSRSKGPSVVSDSQAYHSVARVGEVVEGQGQPFEVNGRLIAVFLDSGTYYAIDDNCPHKGAPLCDGIVMDRSVTCTWHGWRFNLTDGRWVDNPKIRVTTYPVRVVGDEIQVAVG